MTFDRSTTKGRLRELEKKPADQMKMIMKAGEHTESCRLGVRWSTEAGQAVEKGISSLERIV
jgi:hypothetical protein